MILFFSGSDSLVCFFLDVEVHSGALCDEKRDCSYHQSKDQHKVLCVSLFGFLLTSQIQVAVYK